MINLKMEGVLKSTEMNKLLGTGFGGGGRIFCVFQFANHVIYVNNWERDILVSLIFCSFSFASFLWYSLLKAFSAAIFKCRTLCSWALKYIFFFHFLI